MPNTIDEYLKLKNEVERAIEIANAFGLVGNLSVEEMDKWVKSVILFCKENKIDISVDDFKEDLFVFKYMQLQFDNSMPITSDYLREILISDKKINSSYTFCFGSDNPFLPIIVEEISRVMTIKGKDFLRAQGYESVEKLKQFICDNGRCFTNIDDLAMLIVNSSLRTDLDEVERTISTIGASLDVQKVYNYCLFVVRLGLFCGACNNCNIGEMFNTYLNDYDIKKVDSDDDRRTLLSNFYEKYKIKEKLSSYKLDFLFSKLFPSNGFGSTKILGEFDISEVVDVFTDSYWTLCFYGNFQVPGVNSSNKFTINQKFLSLFKASCYYLERYMDINKKGKIK